VARADLLLSTAPGEAFGRTIAEAALLGVPALVAGGGPAELVRDGVTGHVLPRLDPEALAARLRLLDADRPALRRVGQAAREHLRRLCDPATVARQWIAEVER
jgi:glycosyltransferase involved in cell wall biosynthesis